MVSITSDQAFLFFGAAIIGGSVGVAGNFFVNALFRYLDDHIQNRRRLNSILLWVGILMIIGLFGYLVYQFDFISQFP